MPSNAEREALFTIVTPTGSYACTGYLDDLGIVAHDGGTCPIHEDEDSPVFAPDLGRKVQHNDRQP